MVNETILGGLRIATSHKSSLKDAMQSFYNSGYSKNEIEEAAKIIFDEQTIQSKILSSKKSEKISQTNSKKEDKKNLLKVIYSKKNIKWIILLVGILIIILGALIILFVFKDKIF